MGIEQTTFFRTSFPFYADLPVISKSICACFNKMTSSMAGLPSSYNGQANVDEYHLCQRTIAGLPARLVYRMCEAGNKKLEFLVGNYNIQITNYIT